MLWRADLGHGVAGGADAFGAAGFLAAFDGQAGPADVADDEDEGDGGEEDEGVHAEVPGQFETFILWHMAWGLEVTMRVWRI